MDRKIARFNKRLTIQRNTTVTDKYGNHTNTWADYYQCWTYASTYQYDEEREAAVTSQEQTMSFEVRYCSNLAGINSVGYRVLFGGNQYNIISVDMMNYQDRTIKLRCKLVQAVVKDYPTPVTDDEIHIDKNGWDVVM